MNNLLHRIRGFYFVLIITLCNTAIAQQPVLNFQTVASGLNNPVDIVTAPGDNRLFVAQQNGLVRIWNGSTFLDFINLSSVITNPPAGEQGLLSMVFHPGYESNRYFFVWYTSATGAVTLARYQRNSTNPDIADPGSGQVLLAIPKPGTPSYYTNHNGGKLLFGNDGMLYIGTGDGGSGGDPENNAQNGNSLLGKMLRIDVNNFASSTYNIPTNNPFLVPGDGIRDEIYAIGLRNPWRWSFDRANGDMWIADVGQNQREEINWRRAGTTAGVNYGWRCYEGAHVYAGGGCNPTDTVSPVFEYPHNIITGGFSVTGGYVYRGPDAQNAALLGYYITADYVSGNVWTIRPAGNGWSTYMQAGLPGNISSFGEGVDGTLYALGRSSGSIYKVMLSSIVPVTITHFNVAARPGYNELEWRTSNEINTRTYHVEFSTDGIAFSRVGQVAANVTSSANRYSFKHHVMIQAGHGYYRLVTEDTDGSAKMSDIIRVQGLAAKASVYPTVLPANGTINLVLSERAEKLLLVNSVGSVAWQKNIAHVNGSASLAIPNLPAGLYVLRVFGPSFLYQEKIVIR